MGAQHQLHAPPFQPQAQAFSVPGAWLKDGRRWPVVCAPQVDGLILAAFAQPAEAIAWALACQSLGLYRCPERVVPAECPIA